MVAGRGSRLRARSHALRYSRRCSLLVAAQRHIQICFDGFKPLRCERQRRFYGTRQVAFGFSMAVCFSLHKPSYSLRQDIGRRNELELTDGSPLTNHGPFDAAPDASRIGATRSLRARHPGQGPGQHLGTQTLFTERAEAGLGHGNDDEVA